MHLGEWELTWASDSSFSWSDTLACAGCNPAELRGGAIHEGGAAGVGRETVTRSVLLVSIKKHRVVTSATRRWSLIARVASPCGVCGRVFCCSKVHSTNKLFFFLPPHTFPRSAIIHRASFVLTSALMQACTHTCVCQTNTLQCPSTGTHEPPSPHPERPVSDMIVYMMQGRVRGRAEGHPEAGQRELLPEWRGVRRDVSGETSDGLQGQRGRDM